MKLAKKKLLHDIVERYISEGFIPGERTFYSVDEPTPVMMSYLRQLRDDGLITLTQEPHAGAQSVMISIKYIVAEPTKFGLREYAADRLTRGSDPWFNQP